MRQIYVRGCNMVKAYISYSPYHMGHMISERHRVARYLKLFQLPKSKKPSSWSRYKQWEMQRPNGSTLNITDDGIQISAGRDNIGRHNLNCIARGPGGITNRLVQVDVLNDYWTNIIFRNHSYLNQFYHRAARSKIFQLNFLNTIRIIKKLLDKYLLFHFCGDHSFNNSCS